MATERKHSRAAKSEWPEPIDADPEDVMRAVVSTPPKKRDEWRYLQDSDTGD